MNLVSILFEDLYEDTDIIEVPDEIYENIIALGQTFASRRDAEAKEEYDWVILPSGEKVRTLETVGFICWLNQNVLKTSEKQARIVAEHVPWRSDLPTVEF